MLRDLLLSREITSDTPWSSFVSKNKDDPRYYDLVGQSYPYISQSKTDSSHALYFYGGSMPREIFEDLIEEEREQLRKLKPLFRSLVKENNVKFEDRSRETFNETLGKFQEFMELSEN
jgi:hypothetical protein